MFNKFFQLCALLTITLSGAAFGATAIRINVVEDPKAEHMASVIELAISHFPGKYTIERQTKEALSQSRAMNELDSGHLDVIWMASNKDVEEKIQPIRIPVFKGLIGLRLLLIRSGDQSRFDNIMTIDDLKKINLGQGTTWADTKILEANGLHVTKSVKYPGLFYMLDGGRFDAFPRSVSEPFDEIAKNPNLSLDVEKNLLLVYRMPFYLFVKNGNNALANDIESGLNKSIADGSFERLFLSNATVQDVIKKANINKRRIIELDNPTLSKETPINRSDLWVDVATFGR